MKEISRMRMFIAGVCFRQYTVGKQNWVVIKNKKNIEYLRATEKPLIKTLVKVVAAIGLLVAASSAVAAPAAKSIKFWDDSEPGSIMNVDHARWQNLLAQYLDDQHSSGINRFNYDAVSNEDRATLGDYLKYLQLLEPRQLNPNEQKAFWINLYNAKIVHLVLEELRQDSVTSIRQIRSGVFTPGPWERKSLKIVMQNMSLDDLVHGILRPNFNDKRVHFVLSPASLGGPNLLKTAFTGANVEELLVKAEADFLSHSRAASVNGSDLILSDIFNEYANDFASSADELLAYISPLISADAAAVAASQPDIRFEYDWALNRP